MPILIGLIVFFIVAAIMYRKGGGTRRCRWRADSSGDRGTLRKYNCVACGAEAFTSTKGPPNHCKSNTKTPSL